MNNQIVDDCEGFLLDSEAGDISGTYDHNENFTFTICVEDISEISIEFLSFCTEDGFDSLRVYDGPDTLSVLIGSFMGTDLPPTLIATSGCMTINFVSDENVSCTGWLAHWETEFIEPEPPIITSIAGVTCETTELTLTFDRNIHCDSIYESAFSITGPLFPEVVSAMPNPCVNDSTNTVVLTLNEPIDFSGNYDLFFSSLAVVCEQIFNLQTTAIFAITDCPLEVDLVLDGDVECAFEDHTLIAEAMGGDDTFYSYQWAPVFVPNNTDEVTTSVFGPTVYYVTVTDAAGATAVDSLLVTPDPAPTIFMPDTMLCQSIEPFTLTAFPPNGTWSGDGIRGDGEDTGFYDPQFLEDLIDTIIYEAPNGCINQLIIDFIPLEEGSDDASCIGQDTFTVSGGIPLGGVWMGEHIDSFGLFTPPDTAGSFLVTYTHPNGCIGDKWINVDTLELAAVDSVCQSDDRFNIPVEPFGGIWSGPGIVDEDFGRFDPAEANAGNNQIIYEANGCSDTIEIHVTAINARGNFNACPMQEPFILPGNWFPQINNSWSGDGIIDAQTGLFDPSLIPHDTDVWLTLEANGCTDQRKVFVFQTAILENDTLHFCTESDIHVLPKGNNGVRPKNGIWYGPGVSQNANDDYIFNPTIAAASEGFGFLAVYYEKNTCIDSLIIEIYPTPNIPFKEFCSNEPPSILEVTPSGGTWSGDGIINPIQGVFSPAESGIGTFTLTNESDNGCQGTGEVTVIQYEEAIIEGLEGFYCYQDNDIAVSLSPLGGNFTINGTIAPPTFNPANFGAGTHSFEYTAGEGPCINSTAFIAEVGEAVSIDLPFLADTVCFGQNYSITAQASGGSSFGNYTYTWNQGLGFGQTQFIQAISSNTFTVTASDGCSDPAIGSIDIIIHPTFQVEYDTGDPVCFEDTTFATAFAFPGNNFTYEWNSTPPTFGPDIESHPTLYALTVTDNESGCTVETPVVLPGFDPIKANFNYSPNSEDCLTDIDPTIQLLDFSIGGKMGYWDFGDSTGTRPYVEGEDLFYTYSDTGNFTITLFLENEGDCMSEFQQDVCIKAAHRLYAPNAFTPNRDGVNDFFQFTGVNIKSLYFQIYDKYGTKMYEGFSMDDRWDGHFKNKPMPNGTYVFNADYTVKETGEKLSKKGYITLIR